MSDFPKINSIDRTGLKKVNPVSSCSTGPIHDVLQALVATVEHELARILERARDHELQLQKALADATLLSREKAARRLGCSVAKLDRLVSDGKLEVTYYDRRPRFPLVELQRFKAAHTGRKPKKPHRRQC